ncbi:hypothetical protein EBT31_08640 [bacterium]|nr:hypothetical protein [bacterium]
MAHFAELAPDNTVIRVIVVGNQDCLDSDGKESEVAGIAFCQQLFGADTRWIQTSYSNSFRGVFAGIDFTYDPDTDTFVAPPVEAPAEPSPLSSEEV